MNRVHLTDAVAQYLALRRALGFKLRYENALLQSFLTFLEAHGASVITTDLAVRWAQQPPDGTSCGWAKRLSTIRCFARYHRAFDPRTEVPPPRLIPPCARHRRPHIFTDEQIALLMREARGVRTAMLAESYATLIGLLAVTGMRVGEAIALNDEDIDWRRALLTVRHAKFYKSRLIPLHESALAALRTYKARRDRICPCRRSQSFLVSSVGAPIHYANFHLVFRRLLRATRLDSHPGGRPRLHDLRHAFAVKSLRDWYRLGIDAERRLPWLSTYLGHVNPAATYRYLTATPELLALAGERLERSWEPRP